MEIAGLPLHPLVVHAAVVFIPLSALATIWFAVMPGWRWLTRWPTAVLAVGALAVAWVARLSGQALLEARPFLLDSPTLRDQIQTHQERGSLLSLLMIPFAALVVAAAWSLEGRSALASGRGARESKVPALEKVFPAVLVLAALGVIVLAVLAGDAGSRAVWG
jgi:hypothetical protein